MLSCKNKNEFEKLLFRMFIYDAENSPTNEFNSIWEGLCEASGVPVVKKG